MKIVYNNIIPFEGFCAITIWPFIFVRKGVELNEVDINHEEIHGCQQSEVTVLSALVVSTCFLFGATAWLFVCVPFLYYFMYITEWVINLVLYGRDKTAYRKISFEREAFANETDMNYLEKRRAFAWLYSVINS